MSNVLFVFVQLTTQLMLTNEITVETNSQLLTTVVLQFLKIKTSFPPAVYTLLFMKR